MATGGLYLARRLEQLLPGVLEQRYRALYFEDGMVVPTVADLEAGAPEVVRDTIATVGDAAIVGDGAVDIPIVDISAGEDRYKVLMIASAFSYTYNQMRAYERGQNLAEVNDRKMRAARRTIAEKSNVLAAFGSTSLGIRGMVNNASVTVTDESTNLYTATADQLASYFIETVGAIAKASNGVEYPNRVLVSHTLDTHMQALRMPDMSMNVKQYILQNSSYITEIMGLLELEFDKLEANGVQSSGTNKDRIVFYPFDPTVVERHIELAQLMPQEWWEVRNGRQIIPMFSCVTPTMINYPGACRYVDHAKKA